MDVEILSRIQFAFTIAFHYIYPPLSIGLGVCLVIIETIYLKTRNEIYRRMAKFWTRIFALTFAIGVATGIVMEFEFGTNWATYSRYVGDVFGSALAAEGVFAFFLESGFLAILLFGWDKVGPKLHYFSTLMVCFGAHFSAVWIVVANSWQQTPAGYQIVGEGIDARAEITDFWAMVFNPSSMDRLSHTIIGCWQAGAWLLVSVSAYYILKKRHPNTSPMGLRIGLSVAAVASILQLISGHSSAEVVAEHQPAKLAAMEGHWDQGPADLYLFGWVDEENEKTTGLSIPGGVGLLLSGDTRQELPGLTNWEPEDRPKANWVFQCYHLMIAIGFALIALAGIACFKWWRGSLESTPWLLKLLVVAPLGPQIANQAGWFTAELGRQPWIVYGHLRTSDGLSKTVEANQVLFSLIGFSLIYALLFALFVFLLNMKIKHGPDDKVTIEGGSKRRILTSNR
ncbi:cytochrome ubiquinol oxidase subunit I [Pelagicoccus sp. SDUM812003]|uniref:cytochrome ubiquinol oxidase subunit I n=1 Tax=Pelagicoccus sp. SDUM812003 TaxID=3041267 RepID=UPI00280F5C97|nr:cytochrome ubiquinol oxidase subunit I [Pelagicoccus sp. SDUM812003]MDQ8204518.1 cytochrome ubiquinol oxidase subunit I [Pelagicoccus sp. SDUM812003]